MVNKVLYSSSIPSPQPQTKPRTKYCDIIDEIITGKIDTNDDSDDE